MRSGQELRRKICNRLSVRIRSRNRFQGRYIALHHAVANGVGEGHVPVVARRVLRRLPLQAVQILDQRGGDCIRAEPGSNACGGNRLSSVPETFSFHGSSSTAWHRNSSISAQGCRRVSPDSRGKARLATHLVGSALRHDKPEHAAKFVSRPTGSGGVCTGRSHPLLTGRTARAFSRVSSTSSVSWRITRRSPSRSVYCTLSRLISISRSWPR